jgi:hypothetical protein
VELRAGLTGRLYASQEPDRVAEARGGRGRTRDGSRVGGGGRRGRRGGRAARARAPALLALQGARMPVRAG